jgi:hypothetical protein
LDILLLLLLAIAATSFDPALFQSNHSTYGVS